ncbi:hypothetical protein [Kitasatospora sp. NBC_01539]
MSEGAAVHVEVPGSVAERFMSVAEAGGSSADVNGSMAELSASAAGWLV